MITGLNNTPFLLQMLLSFLATVLLIEGLYGLWRAYRGSDATRLASRLRALAAGTTRADTTSILKKDALSAVPALQRWLLTVPGTTTLGRLVFQAGISWPLNRLLLLCLLLALIGMGIGQWLAPGRSLPIGALLAGLLLGAGLAMLPAVYVFYRRASRLKTMARQLPDALDLLVRSLRAGHSLASGLKMVGDEMDGPLALEFGVLHDEINYGVATSEALAHLLRRVPLTDLAYFTVAVQVQRETGGNLTEVLDKLSRLIRQRLHLRGKIRALTAEGRLSAWVLGLLPFALAGLLAWGNPDFIGVLWQDPVGIALSQATLLVMLLGVVWLWRITQVRI